jgi:hypothetical protein
VDQRSSQSLPPLIRDLQREIGRARQRPRAQLYELVRRRVDAPHEILDWAKRDRRWSFTLAEVMTEPGRPRDLAARLVLAIIDDLEQEREVFDADAADGGLPYEAIALRAE